MRLRGAESEEEMSDPNRLASMQTSVDEIRKRDERIATLTRQRDEAVRLLSVALYSCQFFSVRESWEKERLKLLAEIEEGK